jgi:hypothetical protein
VDRIDTPLGPIFRWAPQGASRQAVVVYVHGYNDTAEQALAKHKLVEQFARSGKRVPFLVPEAPTSNQQAVRFVNLPELLASAGIPASTPVVAVAHSGGYRTLLPWLSSSNLRHLVLLDAVYGGRAQFETWAKKPGHSLDIVGQDTAAQSQALAKATSSPYTPASSHMGIVTDGKLIPQLLSRAPIPTGGAKTVALAVAAFIGWGLWRLLR